MGLSKLDQQPLPWRAVLAFALGCAVFLSLAEFNTSLSYTVPAMNAAALALAGGAWWMGWLSV